jgi:hypothetical protein
MIDSLIPRDISVIELSKALCQAGGVNDIKLSVIEVDAKTETIRLVINGTSIDFEAVAKIMGEHAATIRGIDEVDVAKGKGPAVRSV